jgi:hypothetical protein
MPGLEFSDVAAALSCETFARRELRMRGNRAQCPFHGGEHYNLQFFKDGRCYCHVCHKAADVVQLAACVWHTNQLDAARLLNDDYNLGLTDSTPTDEQRRQRDREREARAAAEQAARDEWGAAADDLREAEQATAALTAADADKPSTWAAVARLGKAQDRWHALQACAGR